MDRPGRPPERPACLRTPFAATHAHTPPACSPTTTTTLNCTAILSDTHPLFTCARTPNLRPQERHPAHVQLQRKRHRSSTNMNDTCIRHLFDNGGTSLRGLQLVLRWPCCEPEAGPLARACGSKGVGCSLRVNAPRPSIRMRISMHLRRRWSRRRRLLSWR